MIAGFLPRKALAWTAFEVLVLSGFVACGRWDDSSATESSEGQPGSGGARVPTGGRSGTGGTSGGGGLVLGVGGTISDPGWSPQPGTCESLPVDRVEPPCTDDDIVVPATCWESKVSFRFSLSGIGRPANDLNLVLLSTSRGSPGEGGQGGASTGALGSSPLVLQVVLEPISAGVMTETGFSVTGADAAFVATLDIEQLVKSGYLDPRESNVPSYPYYVGMVALLRGDVVLDEKRLIVEPLFPCIVK